jgi:hypothetical protein
MIGCNKYNSITKYKNKIYKYQYRYCLIKIYSGSKNFLNSLSKNIEKFFKIKKANIIKYKNCNCYKIKYSHYDSIKMASFIYKDANIFLQRKYDKIKNFIKEI